PGAQRDVYALAWHPRAAGRAYEAAGGGAAFSRDDGDTWHPADDGMDRHYTWAVAVDPEDADCWFVSASTGPFKAHRDGNPEAGIYRRRRSEPWQRLRVGLPDPLPSMPYALVTANGRLFAGLRNGELWESGGQGLSAGNGASSPTAARLRSRRSPSRPVSADAHNPRSLGHDRFSVVGHDRGPRVAY